MNDLITLPDLPPPVESQPATQAATPVQVESELDQKFHDVYRQRLAGRPVQEIADAYGVDRTTVWRWCRQVEIEAQEQLANVPVFNIISREVARLDDLEQQARAGAESTKSDRAKAIYLSEARRAAVSRQSLLLSVGIIPKAPEEIYRITATMKPGQSVETPIDLLPRPEAVERLIEQMQRSRVLS